MRQIGTAKRGFMQQENKDEILEKIDLLRSKVSPRSWNAGFLDSIRQQYVALKQYSKSLSPKQISMIDKIQKEVDKLDSPEEKEFRDQWKNSPEMRERTEVVAKIYRKINADHHQSYFLDLLHRLEKIEDYVPTSVEYNKLVMNEYSIAYWQNYIGEPKFQVGEVVELSTTIKKEIAHTPYKFAFKDFDKAVVLSNEKIIPTTHAKGGKLYLILPYGQNPVLFAERHLKFAKKSKKVK